MFIICPYMKGSEDGARCSACDSLIRDIEDMNIRVCLSRHFEACCIYHQDLQRMAAISMEAIFVVNDAGCCKQRVIHA